MRLLHTGDWHLGKYLGPFSRMPEQEQFVEELIGIARDEAVDLVIIAGDVFDTYTPSSEAEHLFFRALKGLNEASPAGPVPVFVIAGNHDSPMRLSASAPIASARGVFLMGEAKTADMGDYGGFSVTASDKDHIEITVKRTGEHVVVAALAFPREARLALPLADSASGYAERVGMLLEERAAYFREDTVNLLAGHFYIAGGIWSADSERPLQVGGAYAVDGRRLPQAAQYIAMGHLHRPQAAAGHPGAFYAGSPIQYAVSETGYAKCVMLADVEPGTPASVRKVYLRNYKPIEQWTVNSVEEAVQMAEQREDCWAYVTIHTNRPLTRSDLKSLRTAKHDIVEIVPVLPEAAATAAEAERERAPMELFDAYYLEKRGTEPSEAMRQLFARFAEEPEET